MLPGTAQIGNPPCHPFFPKSLQKYHFLLIRLINRNTKSYFNSTLDIIPSAQFQTTGMRNIL
jgi:hypothetical protein